MSFTDFDRSGFTFAKEEFHLQTQFKMLNWIIVVSIISTLLLVLKHYFIVPLTNTIHIYVNEAYILSSIIIFILLRRSKAYFFFMANLFLFFSFLTFTSALIFITNDAFRMIWFVLLLFVAYFISGKTAGWLVAVGSTAIFIITNEFIDLKLNDLEMTSSIIGVLSANFLALAYSNKINEYEAHMNNENSKLTHMASTDDLTGTMIKRVFTTISNQYFTIAKQHQQDLSLILLEIDSFKMVIDTYGRKAGDNILAKFSKVIQSLLNKHDVVSRVSGETFAILLLKTDINEGFKKAEKLRKLIEAIDLSYEDAIIHLTCSIGIVQINEDDDDFDALFKRADKALDMAKENGRNNTHKGN